MVMLQDAALDTVAPSTSSAEGPITPVTAQATLGRAETRVAPSALPALQFQATPFKGV